MPKPIHSYSPEFMQAAYQDNMKFKRCPHKIPDETKNRIFFYFCENAENQIGRLNEKIDKLNQENKELKQKLKTIKEFVRDQ
jgi:hypothetical protein